MWMSAGKFSWNYIQQILRVWVCLWLGLVLVLVYLFLPAEETEIYVFIVSFLFVHLEFIQKQKTHLCPILKILS